LKQYRILAAFLVGVLCCVALRVAAAPTVQVTGDRWLEVRQVVGNVRYRQGQSSQPARKGMRLSSVGAGISTGGRSKSILATDTGISFLHVSENTSFKVQQLRKNADGGRFTRLIVDKGQIRLQTRKFTHKSSGFELQTPAGVVGVRGTRFGVGVQPDGKTGVATEKGRVVTTAQGKTITVNAGFQSLTVPGETPSTPQPLRNDPSIDIRSLICLGKLNSLISFNFYPFNVLSI